MTAQQEKNIKDWAFKQGPTVVVLFFVAFFEYQYFTSQIEKMEVKYEKKIEKLELKVEQLENRLILEKFSNK